MLFNSLTFILLFLPLALLGFYGLARVGHRWAAAWLVVVSFVFYSWWAASLVFLLGGSIAFNFTCGALILRTQGREKLQSWLLTLGIIGDLALLIYYKYLFALLDWLGLHGIIQLSHTYSMILPLGISFYTFTQIGYLVDCKGGVVKSNRLLDYCLFVTFFPHLIAGPILHHREMMPQFAEPKTYLFRWQNLAVGATLFIIGLTKKVVIADHFVDMVAHTYAPGQLLPLAQVWEGVLAYALQLYFDFSGYSDMACGLALLFGLRFPANFNSPYRAASIIDYWQRFHMTLTRYITLYVFGPIALWITRRRVAQGKSVAKKALATPGGFLSLIALPTMVTMTLAGVWHGAGLQFFIFGLLHGIYITINHAWRSLGPRVSDDPAHSGRRTAAHCGKIALTFLAIVIAQVFFRTASVHDALRILYAMTGAYGLRDHGVPMREVGETGLLLALLFLVVWTMPNSLQILDRFQPTLSKLKFDSPFSFNWQPNIAWAVAVGAVASLALLEITGMTEFIYFRF